MEHKNKISKLDFHNSTPKGGGRSEESVQAIMLDFDVVRYKLLFQDGVGEKIPEVDNSDAIEYEQ